MSRWRPSPFAVAQTSMSNADRAMAMEGVQLRARTRCARCGARDCLLYRYYRGGMRGSGETAYPLGRTTLLKTHTHARPRLRGPRPGVRRRPICYAFAETAPLGRPPPQGVPSSLDSPGAHRRAYRGARRRRVGREPDRRRRSDRRRSASHWRARRESTQTAPRAPGRSLAHHAVSVAVSHIPIGRMRAVHGRNPVCSRLLAGNPGVAVIVIARERVAPIARVLSGAAP